MVKVMIKVLDKGYVRLVDHMGSDLSVVRSARVSYDAEWRAGEDKGSDDRLIKYLWKNHHSTPFESVQFTFEVKAPLFILRQWHRHRTWTYNEVSARYTELPDDYYVPDPDKIGVQSKDNKQARDITDVLNSQASALIALACASSFETYHDLLAMNVPREIARGVLPMNTYSRMFATVDLLNLLKFIELRNHSHAQYEMQQYAKTLLELVEPIVPVCIKAFNETPSNT